ncbi:MAG: hypothetical protein ISS47_09805 [Candidatus Omnitrophica bacterium]|nr:hypothetical protein [Candidatus Omnitrophota bacterium]
MQKLEKTALKNLSKLTVFIGLFIVISAAFMRQLKKLLNWQPEVKFIDGLHRTID